MKDFLTTPIGDEDDISDVEERYLELALEAVALMNEQEKKIFGNQSFFYRCSEEEGKLGTLVQITDCYLTKEKVDCLR